jgi:hypothetical protein
VGEIITWKEAQRAIRMIPPTPTTPFYFHIDESRD